MGNINVTKTDSDAIYIEHHGRTELYIDPVDTEALREFFRAERDAVLGRWRDPENLDVVVYRRQECDDHLGRCAAVLNEAAMTVTYEWERYQGLDESARRYFAAHPEPKPWMNAVPGEVWMLTFGGVSGPHLVNQDPRFVDGMGDAYGLNDHRITEGCRIWPVDEEGDDRE